MDKTENARAFGVYEMSFRLHQLRGWKVVEAENEDGVMTEYLMVPMEINAIRKDDDGKPYMYAGCLPIKNYSPKGWTHFIAPSMSEETHDSLVSRGLLGPDERWTCVLGNMRRKR